MAMPDHSVVWRDTFNKISNIKVTTHYLQKIHQDPKLLLSETPGYCKSDPVYRLAYLKAQDKKLNVWHWANRYLPYAQVPRLELWI